MKIKYDAASVKMIACDLDDLMKESPLGLSVKQVCEYYGVPQQYVNSSINKLYKIDMIKSIIRPDGKVSKFFWTVDEWINFMNPYGLTWGELVTCVAVDTVCVNKKTEYATIVDICDELCGLDNLYSKSEADVLRSICKGGFILKNNTSDGIEYKINHEKEHLKKTIEYMNNNTHAVDKLHYYTQRRSA